DNDDFHVNWDDFEEDFTVDNVNSIQDRSVKSGFTTARNKTILIPVINQSDINNNTKQLFTNKTAVKLNFSHQEKSYQASLKKTQNNDKHTIRTNKDTASIMEKGG
ncbi:GSCOCG00011505001-RA-CDS, partial [Cotesia congregata]